MFSTTLEIALTMLSFPLLALVCIVVLAVSFQQARRKGYRPPSAALIVLAGWAAGIAATVMRHPPNSTSYRFLIDFFWLPLLFSAAATAVLILVLPRRPLRRFEARRAKFSLVRFGQAIIGASVLLCVVTLVVWLTGHRNLSLQAKAWNGLLLLGAEAAFLIAFILPTANYLIRRGRRLGAAPPVDEQSLVDERPLVLYLRAFKQERQFFVIGRKSEYGKYAKSLHARVSGGEQKIGITFEEYLSNAVEKQIGRFVALGSPEDYLAPEGALRIYAKDTDWMEKLDRLARHSACILVEMGKSENLRWEFEHLRREALQEKLFVIRRPSTEGSWLAWAFWGLLWRFRGIVSVSRQEFAEDLAKLGYDLGPEDPGPGSVITFDGEGRGILLTAQADRPSEFVEPIRAWTADREKVGRYIPSSCSKCGRRIYAFPQPAGTPAGLCRDCEEGSPARRVWYRLAPSVYLLLGAAVFVSLIVAAAIWVPEGSWMGRHLGGVMTALLLGAIAAYIGVPWWKMSIAERKASRARAAANKAGAVDRNRGKRAMPGR